MNQDEQKTLLEIVTRWAPKEKPEYRGFRCANCQVYFTGDAWHHFVQTGDFLCPVHFCDGCEGLFKNSALEFKQSAVNVDHLTFGSTYSYTPEAIEEFNKIIKQLPEEYLEVKKKPFECDLCKMSLEKSSTGQQEGWHAWWNNNGTLVELHFCRECGKVLGLSS